LIRSVQGLSKGSTVIEAGCGTGNYICALAELRPDIAYLGFDLSQPMLDVAQARGTIVKFVQGDASTQFPCAEAVAALVFAVDVVHHLVDLQRFFQECRRVLGIDGRVIIVTDSYESMRARSLTKYFPEILRIEQQRYPGLQQLHSAATAAGLVFTLEEQAIGDIPLSEAFLAALEARCSSAMRLIPAEAHAAGMASVRAAQREGALWRSHYVVLHYRSAP
jgi:SAM-dependent methyltransferase